MNLIQQLVGLQATVEEVSTNEAYKESNDSSYYEESADFDSDMGKVQKMLDDAKDIFESSAMVKHMKDTDSNFDTNTVAAHAKIVGLLKQTITACNDLYDEMMDAA